MGEPLAEERSVETEENEEMYQSREHTILPGFPVHPSSPFSSSSRFSNALSPSKLKLLAVLGIAALVILIWASYRDTTSIGNLPTWTASPRPSHGQYLSQSSYLKYSSDSTNYRIAIISDMDTASHIDKTLVFRAEVKEGRLIRKEGKYSIEWELTTLIKGEYNEKGRGMELSELINYNNMLLTCDDRTGIVYEISLEQKLAIPRWIMPGGDGRSSAKGMKCEWMTVKDEVLYMGSIGKEYIRNGKITSFENTWIKTLDRVGGVHHIDWKIIYDKLRSATGTEYPGYLVHEAVGWSDQMRKWVFLPRRASKEAYDEKLDERKGANLALIVDEDFSNVRQVTIGKQEPSHGFSSFKFIPFREHEIVALKSVEDGETIKTFMMVFDLNTGEILMDETEVSSTTKFEGVEFL